MAFKDCIISARDQGALSAEEADDLIRRYDRHVAAQHGTDHPGGPAAAAKEALAQEVSEEAARKQRLARLAADKAAEISDHLTDYRDLATGAPDVLRAALALIENRGNELAGVVDVIGRRDALIGLAHGLLGKGLYDFRRSWGLGRRLNPARLDHVVDEAFGTGTGDAAARGFLDAWRQAADMLVDRFNAAGGGIVRMKDYFPQTHNAIKIHQAGEKAWKEFIAPRLDLSRMVDPLSGGALTPARLDEALSAIWPRIVTNGVSDLMPSGQPRGRGALANQRQEERFLHFKDAASWREYAEAFGNPDAHAVMMDHIHGLAKDLAALEVLGPNPNATIEWLKQVVESEAAKKALGQPSLFADAAKPASTGGALPAGTYKIDNLWQLVNGSAGTAAPRVADLFEAGRNLTSSVVLAGTAVTAALGDPVQQAWAARFAGLPKLRSLALMPAQILSGASKRDVIAAGIVWADALDHMTSEFRHLSWTARSREASRYLPDRVFAWTGLTPLTRAERRAAAVNFMIEADRHAGQTLAQIAASGQAGENFARMLRGFAVDDAAWDLLRQVPRVRQGESVAPLSPSDVYRAAGDNPALAEAALRYSAAVHGFMEEAVPEGTNRARAALGRMAPKGSVSGEAARGVTTFMVYPTSMMMSLWRAASLETMAGGLARGGGMLGSTVVAMTLAGAAINTVRDLLAGRDPEPPTSANYWLRALTRGGGFGYIGDWLFADYQRGSGDQVRRFAGPVVGLAGDVLATVAPADWIGTLSLEGSHINRGARAVDLAKKVLPFHNMWWLRPATERLIWDNLQRLADPRADQAWQARANKLYRDTGQGMWWRRGQTLPDRAPALPF